MKNLSLDALLDAYAALSQRDRRLAIAGALMLIGIVLFSVLIPLDRAVAHARTRLEQKRTDLAWMQTVAVPALRNAPAPNANGESLLVLVDRSTREARLDTAMRGSDQGAAGSLSLRLEKAPFDALVAWLARLAQQNGVVIDSATIEKTGDTGLVNAAIVLRPGLM
jgi:type II secretory pathway component PulM